MRNRSSLERNAASARLRSVMSREMPQVPMIRPAASRRGNLVVTTQLTVPSGQVSFSSRFSSGRPVRTISCSSVRACSECYPVKKSVSDLPTI